MQFYGECWSGPFAEFNYARDGKSDKCIMNFEAPTACVKDEPKECVGQAKTNYIYMLTKSKEEITIDTECRLVISEALHTYMVKRFLTVSSSDVNGINYARLVK